MIIVIHARALLSDHVHCQTDHSLLRNILKSRSATFSVDASIQYTIMTQKSCCRCGVTRLFFFLVVISVLAVTVLIIFFPHLILQTPSLIKGKHSYHQHKLYNTSTLWYYSNDTTTRLWGTVHYEYREFPYGGPALILMVYHFHNKSLPNLNLEVENDCLKPKWIAFGKLPAHRTEIDYLYFAVYLLKSKHVPDSVQVLYSDCTTPLTQNLPVYHGQEKKKVTFATCLHQPLKLKDDKLLDIVSWLEIQLVVGVEHITIYDQNIGPSILKTLQSYQRKGFVDIIDWKLNNTENRIGVNGQLGLINDCFYRYLGKAQYILFIDKDELIIPHFKSNLNEMIKYINERQHHVTQYRFYNSFWHDVGEVVSEAENYAIRNLYMPVYFKRTHRTADCPSTTRYKNIIETKYAARIGVHHVYSMKKGQKRYQVPPWIGLMHHYRSPDYAINEVKIRDDIMSKYVNEVMSNMLNFTESMNT